MRKFRGFRLGKGISRLTNWVFSHRRRRSRSVYNRLISGDDDAVRTSPITNRIRNWGRRLAKSISNPSRRVGPGHKPVQVPKGQLAVYVGQKDERVLVPVIYINHPLFGELLKGAQEEYGFHQQGGITIPCPFSEFERVKTRIDAGSGESRRR
ncbi:Auxin-responsive protein SAUR36 [Linum grandiflorum]